MKFSELLAVFLLEVLISFSVCQGTTETADVSTTPTTTPTPGRRNIPLYRVATVEHAPWVMSTGDGQYEGFLVDLLDMMANKSGFEYVLKPSSDNTYGSRGFKGEWGGIIGDLKNNIAEIGAADLVITEARRSAVTFSAKILASRSRILLRKPDPAPSPILLALLPFTWEAWVLLMVAFGLVVVFCCLIDRFSPYGWNALPGNRSKNQKKRCGIWKSCAFALRSLLFQGSQENPLSFSGRILAVTWWAFSLMTVLFYVANLTVAMFSLSTTGGKPVIPFKTFEEMSRQSNVAYGGWFGMVFNPNDPLQRSIERFISSGYTHYNDIEEAVDRVENKNRPFAAIVNSLDGAYLSQQNCDLMVLQDKLFDMSYAFACAQGLAGESICNAISNSILELRERGDIYLLQKRWWDQNAKCPELVEDDFVNAAGLTLVPFKGLEIAKLTLAYAFLLVGLLVCGVVLLAEIFYRRRHPVKKEDSSSLEDVERKLQADPQVSDKKDLERLSNPDDPLSEQVEKYVEEPY